MGGESSREGIEILGELFAKARDQEITTKGEWAAANRCRLYMQVLLVADIVTEDGKVVGPYVKQ